MSEELYARLIKVATESKRSYNSFCIEAISNLCKDFDLVNPNQELEEVAQEEQNVSS